MIGIRALFSLLRLTLSQPAQAMRALIDLRLGPGQALSVLAVSAIASTLLLHLLILTMPPEGRALARDFFGTPFISAALQLSLLVVGAVLIHGIGRARGGRGSLADAMLAVGWLQAVLLVVQLAQILLLLLVPGLSMVVTMVATGLFFWLLTNFVAEVHGFPSLARVLIGIVATIIAVLFILSFLLSLILGPEALEALQNV